MLSHNLGHLGQITHMPEAFGKIGAVPVSTKANDILSAQRQVVVHVGEHILGGSGTKGSIDQVRRTETYTYDTAKLFDGGKVAVPEVSGMTVYCVGIGMGSDKGFPVLICNGQKIIYTTPLRTATNSVS